MVITIIYRKSRMEPAQLFLELAAVHVPVFLRSHAALAFKHIGKSTLRGIPK